MPAAFVIGPGSGRSSQHGAFVFPSPPLQRRPSSVRRLSKTIAFAASWSALVSRSSRVTSNVCVCACMCFGLIGRAPIHSATRGGSHARVSKRAGASAVVDHGRWSVLCNLHRLPAPPCPPTTTIPPRWHQQRFSADQFSRSRS